MKTKSTNLSFDILLVLYQNKELWLTSFDISCLCVIPPDRIARYVAKEIRPRTASDVASRIVYGLFRDGKVEKRKRQDTKNEYRIAQKGIEYIEKVKGKNL